MGVAQLTIAPDTQLRLSALATPQEMRRRQIEATQGLLGDTISLSEQAWQEPSRLPGWTRAHVASHVARNAEALCRSIDSVLNGRRGLMYDLDEHRDRAIERGSERSGLELQIDLDTTAGRLNRRLNVLESMPPDLLIELLPGRLFRCDLVPLLRLNELIVHHVDLDSGFEVTDIGPETARWLLELNAAQVSATTVGSVRLRSDSGFKTTIGLPRAAVELSSSDELLLGWLIGRLTPEQTEMLGFPEQPRIR